MASLQTRNSCLCVFSVRNTWKTRNTEMRRTWLKSWKVSKVSRSVFQRVCLAGPLLLVDLVSLVCWQAQMCGLLVLLFLWEGQIVTIPEGLPRPHTQRTWRNAEGHFLFVISRTFPNFGWKLRELDKLMSLTSD